MEKATVTELFPDLDGQIIQEHKLYESGQAANLAHAIRCGELLKQKKMHIPRGEWKKKWSERSYPFSYETGALYMQAFEQKCKGLHFSSLTDLRRQRSVPKLKTEKYSWAKIAMEYGLYNGVSGGSREILTETVYGRFPNLKGRIAKAEAESELRDAFEILSLEKGREPEEVLPQVKESDRDRFNRLLEKARRTEYARLRMEYYVEVDAKVKEIIGVREEAIRAKEKELEEWAQRVQAAQRDITYYMTEEEFRLVRACLHPDKLDRTAEQLNKAFLIFVRLENYIAPTHSAFMQKRGWS